MSHRLRAQDVASPVMVHPVISVVVIGPDGFHRLSQGAFVLQVYLCEGDSGAGVPVDRPGLPVDNVVGNPHLPTQGRQEDSQLSHHPLSLLILHQVVTVLTTLEDRQPLSGDIPFTGSFLLSLGQQALLLLLFHSWPVLVGQLKQLSSCLVVQGLGELGHRRRHFQPLVEDDTLPLQQPDVVGPFDEAGEVPFRLDVLSYLCQNS